MTVTSPSDSPGSQNLVQRSALSWLLQINWSVLALGRASSGNHRAPLPSGVTNQVPVPGGCAPREGRKKGRGLARARGRLAAHSGCLNLCSNPAACPSKFHVSSEYCDPQIRADQVRSFCSSQISFAALTSSVKMLKS